MSFGTDIYTIMIADASINSDIDGSIKYEHLDTNWSEFQNNIVYTFAKEHQTDVLGGDKNLLMYYNLFVKVISPDNLVVERISDRLVEYLNNKQYSGIIDITFMNDSHSLDLERGTYETTSQFQVIYK